MYQFLHVESYGINSSSRAKNTSKGLQNVSYIVNEAVREKSSIPHIQNPEPPIYLYGQQLEKLEESCRKWISGMKDTKGRKLRFDALALLAGVISAPESIEFDTWQAFKKDAVVWLKEKYGDELKTVIEHTDEANPHLHFYVVPKQGQRFETVHQGRQASANANAQGLKKGLQNQAYKQAMRDFQDEFHNAVAAKYAMARIGPGKRRLSREAWKIEQVQALHAANTINHAIQLVAKARTDALSIKAQAKVVAQTEADQLITEAKQIICKAETKAAETIENAEKKGFAAGVEKAEKTPFIQKILKIFSKAARERDELKTEIQKLSKTANAFNALKTKAQAVFSDFKNLDNELKKHKRELKNAKETVSDFDKLNEKNKRLKDKLLKTNVILEKYKKLNAKTISIHSTNSPYR